MIGELLGWVGVLVVLLGAISYIRDCSTPTARKRAKEARIQAKIDARAQAKHDIDLICRFFRAPVVWLIKLRELREKHSVKYAVRFRAGADDEYCVYGNYYICMGTSLSKAMAIYRERDKKVGFKHHFCEAWPVCNSAYHLFMDSVQGWESWAIDDWTAYQNKKAFAREHPFLGWWESLPEWLRNLIWFIILTIVLGGGVGYFQWN